MGNPIQGTNVFGPVVPFNTDDIYASHKALYGQGGWRTVKNLTDRNAILLDRREDLMIVAVEDNSFIGSTSGVAFYLLDVNHNASTSTSLLDNNNWVLLNFGYGGDGWVFPPPPQSVYAGKRGQRSFDDTYLYICVENDLWKRVAIDWFIDSGTSGFSNGTSGLNFGDVPIFGSNGEWDFDLVVKDLTAIDSTAGNLLVTFTNNQSKILEIGGDRWILPPPMSSVWSGKEGDRSYDDNYFYVCIQDNLWKRSAYDFFIFGASTSGGGGSFFSLPNGYVPIWNASLGKWEFNKVVSNVEYDDINNALNIIFTNNNTTSFIINSIDNLNDLDDVLITNATSGEILVYDGNKWINELFPNVLWSLPTPTSSASTGKKGELSYDDNFIYVCIETNTWKRINIDYFVYSGSTSGGLNLPIGSIPIWDGVTYDTTFAVVNIQPTVQSGQYGEIITYSNGTSSFIPFGTSGNTPIFLNLYDLDDVNVNVSSSSGIGNYLKWNGTKWVNSIINIPNSTTAGNGLSITSNIIELGGTLSKNTSINLNNFNLNYLNGSNSIMGLSNNGIINYVDIKDNSNILSLNTNDRILYSTAGIAIADWKTNNLKVYNPPIQDNDVVNKIYVDSKSSILFTQLFTETLNGDGINPQSEISLISSSSGNFGSKILLANSLKVGDIIKIKLKGFINVSSTGTFTLNIKLGSTVLSTNSSVIISNPKTNQLFDMEFEFIVMSIGSSGNVLGNGKMIISSGNVANPIMAEFVMTSSAIINTTINQTLDFTISWLSGFNGNINNTITYIKKEKI